MRESVCVCVCRAWALGFGMSPLANIYICDADGAIKFQMRQPPHSETCGVSLGWKINEHDTVYRRNPALDDRFYTSQWLLGIASNDPME